MKHRGFEPPGDSHITEVWLHLRKHCAGVPPQSLCSHVGCVAAAEQTERKASCRDVRTHSTDDDAVSQTQRLPQDSKLLCNLIGELPA